MKRIIILCFAALGLAQLSIAQTNTPESIKKAADIIKQYPEASVYVESNATTVSYEVIDRKSLGASLSIRQDRTTEYLALKDKIAIGESEVYNSFSSVNKMILYNKYGTKYTADVYTAVIDKAVESDGIFHSDVRYKYFNMSFPYKGGTKKVEVGKKYTDFKFIDALYFHNDYPQASNKISIKLPKDVQVDLIEYNFEGYKIEKTTSTDPKTFVKTINYTLDKVEPYTGEFGSTGSSMNLPHIVMVVKSYSLKGLTTNCFEGYSDFYSFLHKLNQEVTTYDELVKMQADKIVADKKTDEEKVKALYYWVQDNIRYIAFEYGIAGFKPMSTKEVLDNKYGDCKAVANLLSSMLRSQGYDSKFVWIHTNYSKYDCTLPYLGIFNHAICVLYLNEKTYFLDCTESYAAFGENAFRIQGRPVMVENGDAYKIETIPFEGINSSLYNENVTLKIVGDKLAGECTATAKGDLKNTFLRKYHYANSEKKVDYFKQYYTRSNNNITVASVKTSDLFNREIPFQSTYSFELSNQVFKDEKELFANLEFDNLFARAAKDTVRLTDFTFDMILNYDIAVTLNVPAGYKVSDLPDAFSVNNEYCKINLSYSVVGNTVVYKKSFVFPNGVIPSEKTAEWIRIQKDLKKYYTNQLTLIK